MENTNIIRSAIVTGGSRGIGRAICIKLAQQGRNVCINYSGNEAAALETKELCEKVNPQVKIITVKADVSIESDVQNLVSLASKAFGQIDILVNNAGITRDNLLARMSTDDFDEVISCNLRGTFLCCKALSRQMMKQRFGRIVNISSVVGVHGNAGQVNYSASKAGVIGLTKSIAKELAPRNVTANAVAPGFISTDMTDKMSDAAKEATLSQIPSRKIGNVSDVADAVCFFTSDEASYITGQVLGVDGGMGI